MNKINICGVQYQPRFWRDARGNPALEIVNPSNVAFRCVLHSTSPNEAVFTIGDWILGNGCTSPRPVGADPAGNVIKIEVQFYGNSCAIVTTCCPATQWPNRLWLTLSTTDAVCVACYALTMTIDWFRDTGTPFPPTNSWSGVADLNAGCPTANCGSRVFARLTPCLGSPVGGRYVWQLNAVGFAPSIGWFGGIVGTTFFTDSDECERPLLIDQTITYQIVDTSVGTRNIPMRFIVSETPP